LQKIIFIALAGALGALARYGLSLAAQRAYGGEFPVGTFAVNMAGSFLFGVIWSLAEERMLISGQTRAILLIGFMGAFTTFSTFMFETGELMRDGEWAPAAWNLLGQNGFGLIALYAGFMVGRLI